MPATDFLDLKRRFHDLRDTEFVHGEFEDPGVLASLDEWGLSPTFGWSELLEHPRVVLLAEAGAGKSREMCEQSRRLVKEGRYAFFVPLEALDSKPLTSLLEPPDEKKFEAWKTNGNEPGWFFLDAVDELKLTNGKLDSGASAVLEGHKRPSRPCPSVRFVPPQRLASKSGSDNGPEAGFRFTDEGRRGRRAGTGTGVSWQQFSENLPNRCSSAIDSRASRQGKTPYVRLRCCR